MLLTPIGYNIAVCSECDYRTQKLLRALLSQSHRAGGIKAGQYAGAATIEDIRELFEWVMKNRSRVYKNKTGDLIVVFLRGDWR